MDKDKLLQDIFDNDPLGLLSIKPSNTPARNEDERLVASFKDILDFYEKHNRSPEPGNGIQEHQLFSRLESIKQNTLKVEMLQSYDTYGLLQVTKKSITNIEELMNDDAFGLLNDDDVDLFDLKHVSIKEDRTAADFVARRKPCKGFDKYEPLFKAVHASLKLGKRKLRKFERENLQEGSFYVHNGLVFLVEKINISQNEHYKPDGKRVREDGRTRCIFENGTESNMLKRSVEKILYANGNAITEDEDAVLNEALRKLKAINEDDQEEGYIYILKSKSNNQAIKEIKHLYKIGFSKVEVEERIKNAIQEPTYLMSDVQIVMTYRCFNFNPQKLELKLHAFFGRACLNLDVFDISGKRHTPREWFIAPLSIIEQAVQLIISGDIGKYRYDDINEKIIEF